MKPVNKFHVISAIIALVGLLGCSNTDYVDLAQEVLQSDSNSSAEFVHTIADVEVQAGASFSNAVLVKKGAAYELIVYLEPRVPNWKRDKPFELDGEFKGEIRVSFPSQRRDLHSEFSVEMTSGNEGGSVFSFEASTSEKINLTILIEEVPRGFAEEYVRVSFILKARAKFLD